MMAQKRTRKGVGEKRTRDGREAREGGRGGGRESN